MITLLALKSILCDQVFSAAKEIAYYPRDGAIRNRLGPGFYSFVDRLKTTTYNENMQSTSPCLPLFQRYFRCINCLPFEEIVEN